MVLHTTAQERQALGITALLLVAGAGVRLLSADRPPAVWVDSAVAAADTPTVSGVRKGAEAERARDRVRSTPLARGERVDVNTASAPELERLPRVGPALAERLVRWRSEHGPLRTLADLDAVPGVGPALLEQLAPHVTLPPVPAGRGASGRDGPLDLNRADAAELDALPGIGPVLAERIVEWRREHGRFGSVEELDRVPGVGPALRARLAPRLRASP